MAALPEIVNFTLGNNSFGELKDLNDYIEALSKDSTLSRLLTSFDEAETEEPSTESAWQLGSVSFEKLKSHYSSPLLPKLIFYSNILPQTELIARADSIVNAFIRNPQIINFIENINPKSNIRILFEHSTDMPAFAAVELSTIQISPHILSIGDLLYACLFELCNLGNPMFDTLLTPSEYTTAEKMAREVEWIEFHTVKQFIKFLLECLIQYGWKEIWGISDEALKIIIEQYEKVKNRSFEDQLKESKIPKKQYDWCSHFNLSEKRFLMHNMKHLWKQCKLLYKNRHDILIQLDDKSTDELKKQVEEISRNIKNIQIQLETFATQLEDLINTQMENQDKYRREVVIEACRMILDPSNDSLTFYENFDDDFSEEELEMLQNDYLYKISIMPNFTLTNINLFPEIAVESLPKLMPIPNTTSVRDIPVVLPLKHPKPILFNTSIWAPINKCLSLLKESQTSPILFKM